MSKKKVLIVAAHPDDEILGIGGTAIRHADNGDDVFCLIMGEGAMSRSGAQTEDKNKLREETVQAARIIGFKGLGFADLPDNSFDSVPLLKIVKTVEQYLERIRPNIIYTHYEDDLNIDHRLTFQAVLTACRPINVNCPKEIYTFETLSSGEWQVPNKKFKPNIYIDIANVIERKIEALKKYLSEIREYPHPRSAEGINILAQYRGLESGLRFAEALILVRKIEKNK